MTKTNDALDAEIEAAISVGDHIPLDQNVPPGLFESDRGNKYLITDNPDHNFKSKVAIALVHRKLRPFTWQALCEIYMDPGRC